MNANAYRLRKSNGPVSTSDSMRVMGDGLDLPMHEERKFTPLDAEKNLATSGSQGADNIVK
jgi:hypothetical protein